MRTDPVYTRPVSGPKLGPKGVPDPSKWSISGQRRVKTIFNGSGNPKNLKKVHLVHTHVTLFDTFWVIFAHFGWFPTQTGPNGPKMGSIPGITQRRRGVKARSKKRKCSKFSFLSREKVSTIFSLSSTFYGPNTAKNGPFLGPVR